MNTLCITCEANEAMPSFTMCRSCHTAWQERKNAEQAAKITAYQAHRQATMTPEQLTAADTNDERCARFDRSQM